MGNRSSKSKAHHLADSTKQPNGLPPEPTQHNKRAASPHDNRTPNGNVPTHARVEDYEDLRHEKGPPYITKNNSGKNNANFNGNKGSVQKDICNGNARFNRDEQLLQGDSAESNGNWDEKKGPGEGLMNAARSVGLEEVSLVDNSSPAKTETGLPVRDPDEIDKLRKIYEQRPYQVEIVEKALKRNTIVCLGSGTEKNFISTSVLKEMQGGIHRTYITGGKRTVFLMNTVAAAFQQADVIRKTTCLKVGTYTSDMRVGFWTRDMWQEQFDGHDVLVMTCQILVDILTHSFLGLSNINLLVIDDCHQAMESSSYVQLFEVYNQSLDEQRPHILGFTVNIIYERWNEPINTSEDLETFVRRNMESLETQMQSRCVPCIDPAVTEESVAKLNEIVFPYSRELSPGTYQDVYEMANPCGETVQRLYSASKSFRAQQIERENTVDDVVDRITTLVDYFDQETETVRMDSMTNENLGRSGVQFNDGYSVAADALELCASIICELGPLCGYEAAKILSKQLRKNKEIHFKSNNKEALVDCEQILEHIQNTYEECIKNSPFDKPRDVEPVQPFITTKAHTFLEKILLVEKDNFRESYDTELHAIVFVERRCTAIVLDKLINLKCRLNRETYEGIKSRHVLGQNMDPNLQLADSSIISREQNKVIKDFKSGVFSVLVATSATEEESLGVHQCNLVVRFNGFSNYSQYVQSKGCACLMNSKLIIMSPNEEEHDTHLQLEMMDKIQRVFIKICNDMRTSPTREEIEEIVMREDVDECMPTYFAHEGSDSPSFNHITALRLLHRYCSFLPSDSYSSTTPNFEYASREDLVSGNQFFRATVYLPMNFPLEEKTYTSEWFPDKGACKKSLAFIICKVLHMAGQLDENLLPVRHLEETDGDDEAEEDKPKEGTRKCQDYYWRKFPSVLSPGVENYDIAGSELFVISVVLVEPRDRPSSIALKPLWNGLEKKGFGILLPPGVPQDLPPIKLFTRAGSLIIRFHYIENDNSVLDKTILSQFHMSMMDICATKHVLGKHIFNIDDARVSKGLVVPLKSFVLDAVQDGGIEKSQNWSDNAIDIDGMFDYVVNGGDIGRNAEGGLVNAIINKTYLNEQQNRRLYYIASISEEKGKDIMEGEVTYRYYYESKYNHMIGDDAVLLEAVPCPSRVNFFEDPASKDCKKQSTYKPERLVPALCRKAFRTHAHLHQQLNVFPYIYYYFEAILNAHELRGNISKTLGIASEERHSQYPQIDLDMPAEKVLEEMLQQSLVIDHNIQSPAIMEILETLTTRQAKFPYDLERLEMLGDSFLKQAVTIYLYYKYPNAHEGILSSKRKRCISNKNLCRIAKIIGLQHIICNSQFGNVNPNNENKNSVTVWLPPGCYREEDDVLAKLENAFPEQCDDDILHIIEGDELNDIDSLAKRLVASVISESVSDVQNEIDNRLIPENEIVVDTVAGDGVDDVAAVEESEDTADETVVVTEYDVGEGIASPRKCRTELKISNDLPFQLVQDKTLADSVEALIGLYFKNGGTNLALELMQKFLGIDVLYDAIEEKDVCPVQKGTLSYYADFPKQRSAIQNSYSTYDDVLMFYERMKLSRLEKILGYEFQDKSFIVQAMTHLSYTTNDVTGCYQQIEFLGDAILDFLITLHIYVNKPDLSPGDLTSLRSSLVNNNTFGLLVVKFEFDRFLKHHSSRLQDSILEFLAVANSTPDVLDACFENPFVIVPGNSEEGYHAPKVLGDLFESIIGAVFMDSHLNLVKTWEVIYPLMKSIIDKYMEKIPLNPIREFYERYVDGELAYEVIDETTIVCVAKYGTKTKTAMGKSRKIAKSTVCYKALH